MRLSVLVALCSTGCLALFQDPGSTGGNTGTVGDGDDGDDGDDNTPDPWLAEDDDGDGLTNGEEQELGTDPDAVDSDGDGYSDFDEVETGHDPTDSDDGIYTGGWPYNPDKDSMEEGTWDERAKEGRTLPRFQTYDMLGDDFDLYDFGLQGKYTIIDVSAGWCSYCQELAKFMAGKSSYFDQYESSYPELGIVRDGVANGDLQWVEIIDQDESGATVSLEYLERWEKKYGFENAPVIADEEQLWLAYLKLAGYPTLLVADENMVITSYSKGDYFVALGAAADLISE
jgi:thiol-disulfide isomerase/thioredoxin